MPREITVDGDLFFVILLCRERMCGGIVGEGSGNGGTYSKGEKVAGGRQTKPFVHPMIFSTSNDIYGHFMVQFLLFIEDSHH